MAFDYGFKSFKGAFFHQDSVKGKIAAFEQKVLSKFGAFTRQRIKTSIVKAPKVDVATGQVTRKRKGLELRDAVSRPGNPPYSHEGSYRRLIFFGHDAAAHSVVVGPVKFKEGNVPLLLEGGGPSVTRKGKRVFYRPHPHIQPAGDEEVRRFPQTLRSLQ